MPRPRKQTAEKRDKRVYVYFSDAELKDVQETADQTGERISVLLRKLALAMEIRPKRSRQADNLVSELHRLGVNLNRVGNNLNQLAYHANADEMPAERSILHVLSAVRFAVDEIVSAIKRI